MQQRILRILADHIAGGPSAGLHHLEQAKTGSREILRGAAHWFRRAAEQGNAYARALLGGRGVPQDDAEAVRRFRLAAEQGDANSQFNLGVMYAEGHGVPRDDAEAVRWYRLAADQGLANAQYILGAMYATGRGVPQDYAEALEWYRLAADQGHATAQTRLGSALPDARLRPLLRDGALTRRGKHLGLR